MSGSLYVDLSGDTASLSLVLHIETMSSILMSSSFPNQTTVGRTLFFFTMAVIQQRKKDVITDWV